MKKTFSKSLLKSAGAPVLAAMAASVFFSASPGLLFAGPLDGNGTFVTRVSTDNGAQNFAISRGPNPNVIVIAFGSTAQGNRVVKRYIYQSFAGNPQNVDGRLTPEIDAIIQQCFPQNGGTPTGSFSGSDVQQLYNFFLAN